MASEHDKYHPKDAIKNTTNAALVTGLAGFGVSAVQNTLAKKNYGAWGVFTRMGGSMVVFSMHQNTQGPSSGPELMLL